MDSEGPYTGRAGHVRPAVLARRLNSFAALHGRCERVHVKTPYKWLRGDRPRTPWSALTAALLTDELGRPITPADLGWDGGVARSSGLPLPVGTVDDLDDLLSRLRRMDDQLGSGTPHPH